jgi:hypothetical protein
VSLFAILQSWGFPFRGSLVLHRTESSDSLEDLEGWKRIWECFFFFFGFSNSSLGASLWCSHNKNASSPVEVLDHWFSIARICHTAALGRTAKGIILVGFVAVGWQESGMVRKGKGHRHGSSRALVWKAQPTDEDKVPAHAGNVSAGNLPLY